MDNILEILIPLIFAAIYFFGNMFSGKSEDDVEPRPRGKDEDPDAIEQQRRIQEEIRRKIMERRQEGESSSRPEPASAPVSSADRALRERRAAVEQRRQQREQEKQTTRNRQSVDRQLQGHPESRNPPLDSQPEPDRKFSWDTSDNIYEHEIEDRLKKIESTRRQAEKLKKQASDAHSGSGPRVQASRSKSPRREMRGPVRATLRDPAAARAAFIYGEVLGPPVTQRKNPTVPGLS